MSKKKDYIALAKLITAYREQLMHPTAPKWVDERFVRDFVIPMAHDLKRDNANFDYARFLAACGVKAEVATVEPVAETVPGYTSRGARLLQAVTARQRDKEGA